LHVTLQASTRI